MAITNGSTVKFGYTSVYNNLTSQLKTLYDDTLIFDADTNSILFNGKNYGTNLNGSAVIITLNNFKDPTIWSGTNKHYIIKTVIYANLEDITIQPGANSIIEFMPGACIGIPYEDQKFIPVTEYDITLKLNHCLIIAPLKLIFSDHCIIVGLFHRNEYIPVEWFGGRSIKSINTAGTSFISNYALYNSNAIKHALNSIENTPLLLSGEFYPIHSGIVLSKNTFSDVNIEYENNNVIDTLIINIKYDIQFSLEIICRGSIVTDNTFTGVTWGTGTQQYKNAAIVVQGDNKRVTINGALIVNANSHDTAGIDVNGKSNNIFINHIVKGKDTEVFTKSVTNDTYSWAQQQSQYIGEGNGIQITSEASYDALWGSNITVNYIGGFNNAVVMNVCGVTSNLITNNTFNIGYILCNNGFDISYNRTYESLDGFTINNLGVEPAISNNVINYSGYTTNELEETAFIPTQITYTNYPAEGVVTPDDIEVGTQALYTNPTLFKIARNINGLSGSLLENIYTKPVFARNTININNTGGIWETFIDAEWMCGNIFNILGICTDCKKIKLSNGEPEPNPTYIVTELVMDVNACSIYNPTVPFVRLSNCENNIFNAPERFPFPYNLVTMETDGLYNTIHNAMSVEDILATLDSNNDVDTADNSIDMIIHYNFIYPTCKILCDSNTTLYVLDYWKKPYGVYETTDTLPGTGVDEELIIINDPSTGSKFGTLYPIKECRGGTEPRTLTNCYYYDMYNFIDVWNIKKQLNS